MPRPRCRSDATRTFAKSSPRHATSAGTAGIGSDAVLGSVGATCPQIAEEADAHDGDDRHDEEFHVGSLLGPGVVTVDDRHHPSAVASTYIRT